MEENKNTNNPEEKAPELAPELKAALEKDVENRKKLAEIYAQCWDDEKFKKEGARLPAEFHHVRRPAVVRHQRRIA